jgi:hypothetical protein
MKMTFCKIPTLILAGAILFFTYAAGLRAQQAGPKPAATVITTNWVGYLVVGKHDNIDPMPGRGPQPTVMGQLEIGIRSDGVLVCRGAR